MELMENLEITKINLRLFPMTLKYKRYIIGLSKA
jgi:hypothetical protein